MPNPKLTALLILGFASGLPLFITSRMLQAWLTLAGVDVATVGWFSLVAVPYSLKFLWSPLVDRFPLPLGRRRGWLMVTQLGLVLAIGTMATQNPLLGLGFVAVNALIIAVLSATQDIAFDAYRTDVLTERERGRGAAVGVLGYRLALLVTGALAFILADQWTWPVVYGLLAGVMTLGVLGTLLAPEPEVAAPPESLLAAVRLPLQEFIERLGLRQATTILGFIVLYRLGDALVNNLATPFLIKLGFTQTDLGTVQGGIGLGATILGVVVGGTILDRLGTNRSLWVFGGLQAVSNLAYVILALIGPNYPTLWGAVILENFCSGLGTAAFVAFLMSLCNPRFSATQYALLSSLLAVSRDILVAPAGAIAVAVGWPLFFLGTILAALPGLFLLPYFAPWNQDKSSL